MPCIGRIGQTHYISHRKMEYANKSLHAAKNVDRNMNKNKLVLTIDGSDSLMDFLSDRSPCTQNAACFHRQQSQIFYLHMHLKGSVF